MVVVVAVAAVVVGNEPLHTLILGIIIKQVVYRLLESPFCLLGTSREKMC